MAKYKSRLRLVNENRRKLMASWREKKGQTIRSKIIAALRKRKPLPPRAMTALPGERAAVRAADLRCVNLAGEKLDGIDLTNAKLQGANLARSSLKNAKLVGADLRDALLRNTDLTGADLRGANLNGAIMEDTKLQGADLTGAFVTDSTVVVGTTVLPPGIIRSRTSFWFRSSLTVPRLRRRS